MGAQESKPPAEHAAALAVFSGEEQTQIKVIFEQICSVPDAGGGTGPAAAATPGMSFDSTQLQKYAATLPQRLAYHLFSYMINVVDDGGALRPQAVNYYTFVIALSHILKGTPTERTHLVASLASGGGSTQSSTTQLIRLIEDLMEAYANTVKTTEEYKTWKLNECNESLVAFTNILLQGLSKPSGEDVEGDPSYNEESLERWTSSCALLQHILDTVFHAIFSLARATGCHTSDSPLPAAPSLRHSTLVPRAEKVPWDKNFSTLLDLPSLVLLNNSLPSDVRATWRFLFSDSIHGESFSTLLKHTLLRGPCVLVIKDGDGHVFGGFTGTELSVKPQYAGDESSFLFALQPTMQVYNVTGYNNNYLYLNRGQETMPNGLGMGGQFDYWGLWLDSDYGMGHSRAQPTCTTYGSPQLSAKPDFKITHLEVWGVGPDPVLLKRELDEQEGPPPTSILDKDQGAKALLEMVNRPQHSEGLREEKPKSPDNRKLPTTPSHDL